MNPFEISNHEKQKEKHAAIQFFRSLLAGCGKVLFRRKNGKGTNFFVP